MKKIKLISLFILLSISLFSNNVVNLRLQNEKLSVAMTRITQQTGVVFSYNPQIVNTNQLVSVSIINKGVREAIDILLGNMYFYTIKGRYVIITSAKKIPLITIDNEVVITENKKNEDKSSGNYVDSGLSSIGERKIADERIVPNSPLLVINQVKETTMLKKITGIITLSALTWVGADAQQEQAKTEKVSAPKIEYNIGLPKSTAQLTFITPLSTDGNSAKDKEYKFSMNILGGTTGGVNGVELGGLFNINKQDMRGLQMSGLFNLTKGVASGVQMASIANIVHKSSGLQWAGVANYTAESNDMQIAGVANVATGSRFQMAGVANVAKGADIQIGTVNIAQHAGFQMGVINISETDEATMFGVLNFVKKGGLFEIGVSANDYVYGGVNLITGTDRLYSILSFGLSSSKMKIKATGFGVGTRLQLGDSPKGIHFELMHNQLYEKNFKNKGRYASLEQARVFYSVRKNKFTLYGGPTINVLLRDTDFTDVKDPAYSIFKNRGANHNFDLWVGAEVGIRFNLK